MRKYDGGDRLFMWRGGRPGLVALAVILAGCVSGPPKPESGASVSDPALVPGPNWTAFRLPGPEEVVVGDFWANGTFGGVTGCVPSGCGPADRRIEVGNLTRPPLPTRFLINLTLETSGGFASGGAGVSLYAPGGRYHAYSDTFWDDRHQTLEAVITPGDDPPYVLLTRFDSNLGDAQIRYALRIQSLTDGTLTYALVPTRISLEANQWLRFEAVENGPVELVHYGSDGRFVARLEWDGENHTYQVPAGPGSGPHTFLALAKTPPVRILANQSMSDSAITWGAWDTRFGPGRAATSGSPVSWTFTVDQQPVAVGMYVEVSQGSFNPQTQPSRGKIESASGTVFEGPVGFGGVLLAPFLTYKHARLSEYAHPNLVIGEYRATFTPNTPQTEPVGEVVVYFEF